MIHKQLHIQSVRMLCLRLLVFKRERNCVKMHWEAWPVTRSFTAYDWSKGQHPHYIYKWFGQVSRVRTATFCLGCFSFFFLQKAFLIMICFGSDEDFHELKASRLFLCYDTLANHVEWVNPIRKKEAKRTPCKARENTCEPIDGHNSLDQWLVATHCFWRV